MSASSKPLTFGASVKTTPPGVLKGAFQCTVTPYGLHLKQGKQLEFLIPAGTPAEYVKANRMRVTLPDYQIEMTVTRLGSYSYRLTRDVAGFLNGQWGPPQPESYGMPWPLWILAALPAGIPIATLGGAIPGAIGGALVMVNYTLLQNEEWSPALRIGAALGVTAAGYAGFIALVLAAKSGRPF